MRRIVNLMAIFLIAVLVTSCARAPSKIINLPEIEKPEGTKEQLVEKKAEGLIEKVLTEHVLSSSESLSVAGKVLTILSIKRDVGVKVDVNGEQGLIINTKNFEIINNLKVETLDIDFSDVNKPKVKIKAEGFQLGEHEYLLHSNNPLVVNGQQVKLEEVGEDYAYVAIGPNDSKKVLLGTEKSFDGFSFRLLKTFYLDTSRQPYVWIRIVSLL